MIEVKQYSSAAEMQAHYRAIGNRFFPAVAQPQAARKAYPRIERTERQIVAAVAERHDVTVEDIMSLCKIRHIVAARYDAMAAIHRARPRWSTRRIGRFFNCDHKVVVNALRRTGTR